jgi:hypothetical protein
MNAPRILKGGKPEAAFRWLYVPVCADCGPLVEHASSGSPEWARQHFKNHVHVDPKTGRRETTPLRRLERVDTYKLGSRAVQAATARELASKP